MKDNQKPNPAYSEFKVAPGVYLGTLMSPEQVARATRTRSQRFYKKLERWTMCGDVAPDLFGELQASRVLPTQNERITAFTGPSGLRYAVFTHQAGAFQHRYLAPLFDTRVANCIRDIAAGAAFGYSLCGEGEQAIVWPTVLDGRGFVPLVSLCASVPSGQEHELLEEYASVVREVKDPERVPSLLEGVQVRYASVSAIPPQELMERVAAQCGVGS